MIKMVIIIRPLPLPLILQAVDSQNNDDDEDHHHDTYHHHDIYHHHHDILDHL